MKRKDALGLGFQLSFENVVSSSSLYGYRFLNILTRVEELCISDLRDVSETLLRSYR